MNIQVSTDYARIEAAIGFIRARFRQQPSLEEIAASVHLSPFHFQKLFTDWAGVSPKKFLQFISIGHAKNLLRSKQATLFDVAADTGLSGTGRLHDLFVNIEGMTPAEYKNGGEQLTISYNYYDTLFGSVIIASTGKGLCYLAFQDDETLSFNHLRDLFPNATYVLQGDPVHQSALSYFTGDDTTPEALKMHLKGTPFQLKVWEALLKIPSGNLATYASIAESVANSRACRAVGSAVGDNPVAYIIPCHRVIRSTGEFGEYHWGSSRKTAMIGWEAASVYGEE